MPTFIAVQCPHCHRDQVVKRGKSARGTQRYLCQNQACATGSFLLDYRNRGGLPEVKELIIDMSLNASGIRDIARSLHISTDTVLNELKKKEPMLESVNTALLRTLNADEVNRAPSSVLARPRWTKCGRLLAAKTIRVGSGMPLIITPVQF
jgi:transposase-like protein